MPSSKKIIISGTGCALADFLYNGINFRGAQFTKYLSKNPGDGGLSPGKLVFADELEKHAGKLYPEILHDITGNRVPDSFNVGGPSIVSLIHASQLLNRNEFEVNFFGIAGNDETGKRIFDRVRQTPVKIEFYQTSDNNASPFTDVFSDPEYNSGQGERTFVNNLGVASDYSFNSIGEKFFKSDIVCFGGTALVPQIHDSLSALLFKAKLNNCISIVNTVFDFRNEKKNPRSPWPLVQNKDDYKLIDVLIMDAEEALKISGKHDLFNAAGFFISTGVHSFIITNGANDLLAWSGGGVFEKSELLHMPVSKMLREKLYASPGIRGDTTGCGDNFAGGIIASLAWQLKAKQTGRFNFIEALSWGIASGAYCCLFFGGTFIESFSGEKKCNIEEFQFEYLKQLKT